MLPDAAELDGHAVNKRVATPSDGAFSGAADTPRLTLRDPSGHCVTLG